MTTGENLRRAQFLADQAYELIVARGYNGAEQVRYLSDRDRDRVEALTQAATAYAEIAGAETAQGMLDATTRMTTGERPAQTGETGKSLQQVMEDASSFPPGSLD